MSATEQLDHEFLKWHAVARVDKFTIDQIEACRRDLHLEREPIGAELLAFCTPDDHIVSVGNALTNIGKKRIGDRLVGTSGVTGVVSSATGRIGVGNGSTAFAVTDTDLSAAAGAGNRQFAVVDSQPTVALGVYTFVSTHGTSVSNFVWSEWGIDGGGAAGTTVATDSTTVVGLINRKVPVGTLGTKTSASSWVFTVTITLT